MAGQAKAAAPAAAAPAAAGAEPAAAPAKKPIILLAGIGLALVALLGVGGWFLAPRLLGTHKSPEGEVKTEAPVKVTVPLGAVVVNIGSPDKRRYLKVAVELGLTAAKGAKEVEEKKPQITDLLISVLATAPVESLGTEGGRVKLKQTVLTRIKEELQMEHVTRVFFTEFVIQ